MVLPTECGRASVWPGASRPMCMCVYTKAEGVQVESRMETADHWITYCTVDVGAVKDATKKTEVHRRIVASYY